MTLPVLNTPTHACKNIVHIVLFKVINCLINIITLIIVTNDNNNITGTDHKRCLRRCTNITYMYSVYIHVYNNTLLTFLYSNC